MGALGVIVTIILVVIMMMAMIMVMAFVATMSMAAGVMHIPALALFLLKRPSQILLRAPHLSYNTHAAYTVHVSGHRYSPHASTRVIEPPSPWHAHSCTLQRHALQHGATHRMPRTLARCTPHVARLESLTHRLSVAIRRCFAAAAPLGRARPGSCACVRAYVRARAGVFASVRVCVLCAHVGVRGCMRVGVVWVPEYPKAHEAHQTRA